MLRKNSAITLLAILLVPCMQGCASDNKQPKAPYSETQEDGYQQENDVPPPPPRPPPPTNDQDDDIDINRLSEAFGHFIGRNLSNPGASFAIEPLIQGIRSGAAGTPSPMEDEEYEQMMGAFQERAFQLVADKNLRDANQFLDKNRDQPGVVALDDGKIQYIILAEGEGEPIDEDNTIKITYRGTYIDGTEFGSSDEAGGVVTLSPQQTIPGFRKGIDGMKKGEKRKIFVHPDLGYGTMGQLPPNQLLIFDIELLDPNAEQPRLSFTNIPQEVEDEEEDEMGVRMLGEDDPNVGDFSYPLGEGDINVGDIDHPLGEDDINVGDIDHRLGEDDTNLP